MDIAKLKVTIADVVDYNWDDELEDYIKAIDQGESVTNHIFECLVDLNNFITGKNVPAIVVAESVQAARNKINRTP